MTARVESTSNVDLVPGPRLAALLVARRRAAGLDLAAMAQRSKGRFHAADLAEFERGRLSLDADALAGLAELYELDSGPVVPERSLLVLDLDYQVLRVGDRTVGFESPHADDILARYLTLLALLRGGGLGAEPVLREADVELLAITLGRSPEQVRSDLVEMLVRPVEPKRRWQPSIALLAAGAIVGAAAVGSFLWLNTDQQTSPSQQAFVATSALDSTTPITLGADAEALVGLDIAASLPGWSVVYTGENPSVLGMTTSSNKTITVFVGPDDSAQSVAEVLMHEIGHAVDLEFLDDARRSEWIRLRDIPPTWWVGDGLNDFAVGAGDFAEAVAALTSDSPSNSVYGEFTSEQLDFVASVLSDAGVRVNGQ